MELHRGRLIDHVHLVVADIEKSRTTRAEEERAVVDPDGNNIEDVHHGAGSYSADSVVITF